MKTKILLASIFTAVLFLTVSCGNDDPKIPAAETFSLITSDATDVGVGGATLNGGYNADQAQYVSKLGFAYRASNGTTWAEAEVTGTDSPFSTTLTGLNSGQQYVYYAFIKLKNSNDIIKGAEKVFSCAAPTLTVNPEVLNFNASGNSAQTVTVTCNADSWTVTADSWITISDKTDTGFKVNVTDNNTYDPILGEIIVTASGNVSKTITVKLAEKAHPAVSSYLGAYSITYEVWELSTTIDNKYDHSFNDQMKSYLETSPNAMYFSKFFSERAGNEFPVDFKVQGDGKLGFNMVEYKSTDGNTIYTFKMAIMPGDGYVYAIDPSEYDFTQLSFDANNALVFPTEANWDETTLVDVHWVIWGENTSGESLGRYSDYISKVVATRTGSSGIAPASLNSKETSTELPRLNLSPAQAEYVIDAKQKASF